MDFPPAIRQSLYSTNLIENFNKHLKRTTHHKNISNGRFTGSLPGFSV
ncbi:ISEf1 transposase [Lactiplantibacillus plantarum]|uniref:ISEf1 transposase n=1 Tax=Lactiplantibacillus plantarum TaxID=1590 RepID=A0A165S976_LACPN|nr:ISEf1 transposase [Lactiplantibacillus plantarum]